MRKTLASVAFVTLASTSSAFAGVGDAQYDPYNPAPAAPASWSYNPYTSGMTSCPQRARGDEPCSDRIAPTAGQPNYWVRCAPGSGYAFGGMSGAQADAQCRQMA